jgi:hypothetical protein
MTTSPVIRIIHSTIRGSEEGPGGGVGGTGCLKRDKCGKGTHLLRSWGRGIEVFGASML